MYYQYPAMRMSRGPVQEKQDQKSLKVYGEGVVTAIPNQVTAIIGAITEGRELTQVQKENSEIINQILAVFSKYLIPQKHISTYDYQVNIEYDYTDGKQVFRGYRVQNLLKITIEDIKQLGVIIDQAIEAGANYISNIKFSVSNPNPFYFEALQKAVKNAQDKAAVIVNDLKVSWNSTPVRIEELRKTLLPIENQITFVKGASTASFEPGILEFPAEVLVQYEYL
jgi:uncharacterized protein